MNNIRTSASAIARLLRRFGSRVRDDGTSPRGSTSDLPLTEREQLIQRLLSTIHNNSILLRGDPGSGKTSMLLHLKERLSEACDPATEFFPVYIDLHRVPEQQLFKTVARAVSEQLALAPTPRPFQQAGGAGFDSSHRELARFLRSVMRLLSERRHKSVRLVLLVDGIDELNDYTPRTTQKVRSLFMASLDGSLVMVATAVKIDRQWEQEGSPWYNFFEEIEVTPLDREPEPASHPG